MNKIVIGGMLIILVNFSHARSEGNETKAGEKLIKRVEEIKKECISKIQENPTETIETQIAVCKLAGTLVIQQSMRKRRGGERPTEVERVKASDIVDRYKKDILEELASD